MTPADLLSSKVTLTTTETAYVLTLVHHRGARKGEPDRRQVIALVARGVLAPVDPAQPNYRWTFSVADIRRYLSMVAA